MKRVHLWMTGKVQGVWFRESAKRAAENEGLVGWVKNLVDGRVEAVAEGDPGALERWVAWCHQGPPGARVDILEREDEPVRREFSAFRVER